MEHEQARSSGAAERYVLGQMSDTERDLFEEHFFDCPQCAQEVRLGEMLRANLRAVAAEENRSNVVEISRWRLPARPAWAIAAALLLVVLPLTAYHSLVVAPLQSRLATAESPRLFSSMPLITVVRSQSEVVRISPEMQNLGLPVLVPPEANFERYLVEVKSDAVELAPVEAPSPPRGVPIEILIPASKLLTGDYRLVLSGLSNGEPVEVLTYNFRIER